MASRRLMGLILTVLGLSCIQPVLGLCGSNRVYFFDLSHYYTQQKEHDFVTKFMSDVDNNASTETICADYKDADFYGRMGGDQSLHDNSDKDIASIMNMCGM